MTGIWEQINLSFDPAQPRDDKGQWSTWFHGTTVEKAEEIKRSGLKSTISGERPYYTLASHADEAAMWAHGGKGAVVEIHVPEDRRSEFLTAPAGNLGFMGPARLSGIKKPIPPEMVHKIIYMDTASRADLSTISSQILDLASDAYLHEARGKHGEWVAGPPHTYELPDPNRLLAKGPYPLPGDHPFFKNHPVSPHNVIAAWDHATPEQKAQGMRWYQDAHDLSAALGKAYLGGDTTKAAGLLAAFSPRTAWPINMFNAARVAKDGTTKGFKGQATGAFLANAQEALDGVPIDKNMESPKINSFAHLIDLGHDHPDDKLGEVVIDRHALDVATGAALTDAEGEDAPIGTTRYHEYVADQYRLAAKALSDREHMQISPYQVQAVTWLVRQKEAEDADRAAAEAGKLDPMKTRLIRGRITRTRNAWRDWMAYAKANNIPVDPTTSREMTQAIFEQIELGWADAWMHETRDTHGRWTHGASLPTGGGREQHGYQGKFEGYDTLHPDMAAAEDRKPLDQPGRPDGAGTAADPIDPGHDMGRAVDLMAQGQHVRLSSTSDIGPLIDEVNRRGDAELKRTGSEPTWDLGYVSVKGTRLFNEQTRGIPRDQMPQLSGPSQAGTESAILAHGANKFIELDPQFIAQLKSDGVDVKNERVPAGQLRATQSQLTATSVAGIARAADNGNPKVLHMLSEPIWVTRDNYVLDGHHRWAADEVRAFTGRGPRDIEIHRINLPVSIAVPYANQFAQRMGIEARPLGNAQLVEAATTISAQLELAAWQHELRGPDGKWVRSAVPRETVIRSNVSGHYNHNQIYGALLAEYDHPDNDKDPDTKRLISEAGRAFDSGDNATASMYLRDAALNADSAGRTSQAKRLDALADKLRDMPSNLNDTTTPLADTFLLTKTMAPKISGLLGGGNEAWNHKVDLFDHEDKPAAAAEIDWDGGIHIEAGVARLISQSKHDPGPMQFNQANAHLVVFHELIHGLILDGQEYNEHQQAYQDPNVAAIEEGFTELGTIQHGSEYLDQAGVGDKMTGMTAIDVVSGKSVDNPDYVNQQKHLHAVLRSEAARLRSEARQPNWIDVARDVDKAADDIDSYNTYKARDDLLTLERLDPTGKAHAEAFLALIDTLEKTPLSEHATASELADRLNDPVRIANKDAWGHYATETARALQWCKEVAKSEGYGKTDVKGSPGYKRVTELADEINRLGCADKVSMMAEQIARASGLPAKGLTPGEPSSIMGLTGAQHTPDIMSSFDWANLQLSIRDNWMKGGGSAARSAAKTHAAARQARQAREAAERRAS